MKATETRKPKAPAYGTDASYDGPPPHELMRLDRVGVFRRESIDLATGRVKTDADGRVLYDEIRYSTRRFLDVVNKGFRLVRVEL
jgi:hypothetical protein